jgi:hypothetical protein
MLFKRLEVGMVVVFPFGRVPREVLLEKVMEVSSSRCVVGNESTEENRGAKEYLGFFEVFRKGNVHDSIFALLG